MYTVDVLYKVNYLLYIKYKFIILYINYYYNIFVFLKQFLQATSNVFFYELSDNNYYYHNNLTIVKDNNNNVVVMVLFKRYFFWKLKKIVLKIVNLMKMKS